MHVLRPLDPIRKPWLGAALCGALATCACGRIEFDRAPLARERAPVELTRDAGTVRGGPDAGPDSAQPPTWANDAEGADAALPSCASGALICEGFERGLDGWSFVRSDGTASINTDSRSGMGALELATRSAGAHAFLERQMAPVLDQALYLRAFVKIPASAEVAGYQIFAFRNRQGDAGLAASLLDASLSLVDVASGVSAVGDVAYPREQWTCIEMSVLPPSAGGATLALDGTPAVRLDELSLQRGDDVRIAIGILPSSNAEAATRLLIDDVVVATVPVGCE